jgi:hypothetical protein
MIEDSENFYKKLVECLFSIQTYYRLDSGAKLIKRFLTRAKGRGTIVGGARQDRRT